MTDDFGQAEEDVVRFEMREEDIADFVWRLRAALQLLRDVIQSRAVKRDAPIYERSHIVDRLAVRRQREADSEPRRLLHRGDIVHERAGALPLAVVRRLHHRV